MTLLDPRGDFDKIVSTYRPQNPEKGFLIRCPAHDDKHASLSVKYENDKLLLNCHAGCAHDAILAGLYAAGVLEQARAVSGERVRPTGRHLRSVDGGKARSGSLGKIVATYDYHDLNGALAHQVVKFEGKQFRQRKQNRTGEWLWSVSLNETILYRLKEVVEADTIYVCEGERDAETVRSLGLVGTTGAMGAGKWQDRYAEAFPGKHIVILQDNDEPGRKHAQAIAVSAHGHGAKSIRIVDFPELPEHGDVTDWIEKGNGREQLEARVRKAPVWGIGAVGDPAWQRKLLKGEKELRANEENVAIALLHSPDLAGRVRFDGFRTQVQCRDLPWDRSAEWRDWREKDDIELARYLQRHDVNVKSLVVPGVVEAVARDFEHHPVRDYLTSLKWDGEARIDDWLLTYAGAFHDEEGTLTYLRAVGPKVMLGAVARIMVPGCKLDTMMTLEGRQGVGKSSLARVLFGSEWFTDQISDFTSKDYAVDLRGKWCVELAELTVMNKSDERTVKSVLSRQVDHYRPPYGRRSIDVPRQTIFFGTTNRDDWLSGDETGNRRHQPVLVRKVDLAALARDRDQLWAEAVHRYRQGEQWHLTNDEEELAKVEQAKRSDDDPWAPDIDEFLKTRGDKPFNIADVLNVLGVERPNRQGKQAQRIAKHLKKRGYEAKQSRVDRDRVRLYARRST